MDKIAIKRGLNNVLTVYPLKNSAISYSVMGEEQAVVSFEHTEPVQLQIGDYILFDNIRFTLNELPTVKKTSTRHFRYDCVFQSPMYELTKVSYMLFDNTDTAPQGDFSLTATPAMFVDLLMGNLNRVFGTNKWKQGEVVEGEAKTLTFSTENCYAVLQRLAKEYDTEFSVVGNVVNLQKITQNANIALEYGSTLYDIERKTIDNTSVVTRLYAFGSERNLAKTYRAKRLLPANVQYLESNTTLYGIIEGQKIFDGIYPRLASLGAGTITQVSDHLTFQDNSLDFDVNACLIPATTAKVKFLTGQCAGYECEVEKYTHATKELKVIANTEDDTLIIPNDIICPTVGDKYVLLDIEMPHAYVEAAEQELLTKAQDYLAKNAQPKVSYSVTFSELHARENKADIRIGDMVRVVDTQFGVDTLLRVVKLHKGIKEEWNLKIELSDTASSSTLARLLGEVENNKSAIRKNQKGNSQTFSKSFAQMQEISQMVETLRTEMLFVGDVAGQFSIQDTFFSPNYSANVNWFYATPGRLIHKTIPTTAEPKTWILPAYSNSTLLSGTSYYLYARCSRTGNTGTYYLSATPISYDSHANDYYFLVGMLSSANTGSRTLQTTYGFTTISGNQITTGKIQSPDGRAYFDLGKGEIGGAITFKAGTTGLNNIPEWQELKEKTNEIEEKIPISWELIPISDKGVNAFNYNSTGALNTLVYSVRWLRSGIDVSAVMAQSTKHLFDFERQNTYGMDDNGISDDDWNFLHRGQSQIILTDTDICAVGTLSVSFDENAVEAEYQLLKNNVTQ